MNEVRNLLNSLHVFEKKVLTNLNKEEVSVSELEDKTGLSNVEVMRGAQWLSNKGLVNIKDEVVEMVRITNRGLTVVKKGLPEKRLLKTLEREDDDSVEFKRLKKRSGLNNNEFNKAIGFAREKSLIKIEKGTVFLQEKGVSFLNKELEKHAVLESVESQPLNEQEFKKGLIKELKKRGLVKVEEVVNKKIKRTKLGLKLIKEGVNLDKKLLERNSNKVITSKKWERFKFRRYNVKESVPEVYPGKKHFLYQVMEMIKRFFTEMGFQEMRSDYVESCFWNYDVMFSPQDHPDRSLMDTFYLDTSKEGSIPIDYAKIVKKVQENGGSTGSKGRGIDWSVEEAKRLILRCHTTQTTFRYLNKRLEPPYKFFSIDRVFRNEVRDATHLPEFHQVEGFVVGEGLTFRHLIGNLKAFYNKMGIKRIKLKPTYNPYTEPSMEIHGYFPGIKKWKALGNSGVFRPEVLKPLGINSPVIAWGLGLERIAMFIHDLDDVRQCLGHTVDFNTIKQKELLTRIKK